MEVAQDAASVIPELPLVLAPLPRRVVSLIYEALLLAALLWCAALLFGIIESRLTPSHARTVFQAYVVLILGAYFVCQWTRGGQTLPMKTWRMRLVKRNGKPVDARVAWVRYLAGLVGLLLFGVGFLWALFDPERQFLHDRLAGTRIVRC
ncbi:MAG TPA: RDD family protein [Burkholderiales bacterium]|nr:RDD family protein [Burkholderiales bacterium]